jgi:hypothetical protein
MGSDQSRIESCQIVQFDIDNIVGKRVKLVISPESTTRTPSGGGSHPMIGSTTFAIRNHEFSRYFSIYNLKEDNPSEWNYIISGTSTFLWRAELSKNGNRIGDKITLEGILNSFQVSDQQLRPPGWIFNEVRKYTVRFSVGDDQYVFTSNMRPFRHVDDKDVCYHSSSTYDNDYGW